MLLLLLLLLLLQLLALLLPLKTNLYVPLRLRNDESREAVGLYITAVSSPEIDRNATPVRYPRGTG